MAGLMALNAVAIDIMLPAHPDIGFQFNLQSENQQQLIVACYILGFGMFQILFGPLADRFGRRGPLIVGVGVYIVGAVLAVFAPNYETLLALRFIQGAGAASTRVITTSIIRDRFKGRVMAEIMSLVHVVFLITPIIAPGLGQIILLWGEWPVLFYFIAGFGALILIWMIIRLPETLDEAHRRPFTAKSVFGAFKIVASNRVAMNYIFASTSIMVAFMAFLNSAQQIFAEHYDLGVWFTLAFALSAGALASASMINSMIVHRWGMRRISNIASVLFFISGCALLVLALARLATFEVYFVCLLSCLFMQGLIVPNMVSLAMEPLGAVGGSASAILGFIQTCVGAIGGLIISLSYNETVIPMGIGLTVCGLSAMIFIYIAQSGRSADNAGIET